MSKEMTAKIDKRRGKRCVWCGKKAETANGYCSECDRMFKQIDKAEAKTTQALTQRGRRGKETQDETNLLRDNKEEFPLTL